MATMTLVRPNLHRVNLAHQSLLFHVPTSSLFELDGVTRDLLALFERHEHVDAALVRETLGANHSADAIVGALQEMRSLGVVANSGGKPSAKPIPEPTQFPLTTVVLNVNTGCNLSCTYCYKEDLDTPSRGRKMSLETAIQSIEMLLRESPNQPHYNVVFFGGEPLSNMGLIRDVVAYCEPRFAEHGARVDFTLTTNATLLTEELIDWFNDHRFGLTVSMDGPRTLHDRNRKTVGGQGTYDVVRRKVDMLLARYTARPVGCRVTLTSGVTDVNTIFDHLIDEVGFSEVGFGPVTSGDISTFNLSGEEMQEVFAGFKRLGERYVAAALEGRNFGFGNLHQLLTDLYQGNRKQLPCGAGVALLAVDNKGDLNLCHRFTGSSMPTFGNVQQGIDKPRLATFIAQRLDRSQSGCNTCRIRNICSGGCYHESYAKYGDASHPSYHYCDLLRDWVDFGIEAYAQIITARPTHFAQYISPRRSA